MFIVTIFPRIHCVYKRKAHFYIILGIITTFNKPMQDQTITKELIKVDQKVQLELLDSFLEKNRNDLTKFVTKEKIKATVVPDAEEFMPVLGEMIRNGQLVSFPTETVYGLGADATNEKALLEIYRVKKRPLTDPIIVHVLDFKSALSLVEDLS